jgi:hypothetical protein
VTAAARALHKAGVISYRRGVVHFEERKRLEMAAGRALTR